MSCNIVGVCGFIGSGKGTIAKRLCEKWGFVEDSFANPLKDAVANIFGWERALLQGDTLESRKWREEVDPYWEKVLESPGFTPRIALQYMGTQAGREVFGYNLWVGAFMRRIGDRKVVVPDVRFDNEINSIIGSGGLVIEVQRGENPPWYQVAASHNFVRRSNRMLDQDMVKPHAISDIHESEREWIGNHGITHLILNDFTVDHLNREIDGIMQGFQ